MGESVTAESVIDASTFAKWFINEPGGRDVRKRFIDGGLRLHAPDHIMFETCNVIWKRREIPEEKAKTLAALVLQCGLECHQLTDELAALSMEIAREQSITFYDAMYLALARQISAALITSDRLQGEAGRRIGIAVQEIR